MDRILNETEFKQLRRWPLIDVASLKKGDKIIITYGSDVFEVGRSPIKTVEELPRYILQEMLTTGELSDETLKYHSAHVDQTRKGTERFYRPHQQDAVFIRFSRNPFKVVVKKWKATSQTFTQERYILVNTIIGKTNVLRKGRSRRSKVKRSEEEQSALVEAIKEG